MGDDAYKIYTLHAGILEYIVYMYKDGKCVVTEIDNGGFTSNTPSSCIKHNTVSLPSGFVPVYISTFKSDSIEYKCISGYSNGTWYNYKIGYDSDGTMNLFVENSSAIPEEMKFVLRDPKSTLAVINKNTTHNNILCLYKEGDSSISVIYLDDANRIPRDIKTQIKIPDYTSIHSIIPLNGYYWSFIVNVNNDLYAVVLTADSGVPSKFPDTVDGKTAIDLSLKNSDIQKIKPGSKETSFFYNVIKTRIDDAEYYVYVIGCFVKDNNDKMCIKLVSYGPYSCIGVQVQTLAVTCSSVLIHIENDITSKVPAIKSMRCEPPILHVSDYNSMEIMVRTFIDDNFYFYRKHVTFNREIATNNEFNIIGENDILLK